MRYTRYAENGGILVINTECGTRDAFNNILELLPPGLFADCAGAEAASSVTAEKISCDEGKPPEIQYSDRAAYPVSGTLHRLCVKNAQTVTVYTTDKLKNQPAVTISACGKGYVILYATDGNAICFYEALADFIKIRFGIHPVIKADDGVLVSSREKNGQEFIFATNMKDGPVKIYPDREYRDEISCETVRGEYLLKRYETVILVEI